MTATASDPSTDDTAAPAWRATPSGTARGLSILNFLLARVPVRVAFVLVWPLVLMWFIHYNRPRIAVQRAMRRMGKRFTLTSALRAYFEYAFTLVERFYLMAGRLRPSVAQDTGGGVQAIEAAVAEDGPLIFLGGHCGALEFGSVALESLGRPVRPVGVADPGAGALLQGVGDPSRGIGGSLSTIVADGTVRSGLKMLKALRAGEILCFKADRVLPGSEDQSVSVPFFGEAVSFPRGPLRIALTARARVMVVSVFRQGTGRYRIVADPLDLSSRDADALTADFAALLEQQVRGQAHQWFNFYPYWPSDVAATDAHPEIVPLTARAAEHSLWAAVAASTSLLGLDRHLGDSLIWGLTGEGAARLVGGVGAISWGLVAGIAVAVGGIVAGAEKTPDAARNVRAHAVGILAPGMAVAGPALLGSGLLASGAGSGTLAVFLAWAWGAAVGAVGPRYRRPMLAAIFATWLVGLL